MLNRYSGRCLTRRRTWRGTHWATPPCFRACLCRSRDRSWFSGGPLLRVERRNEKHGHRYILSYLTNVCLSIQNEVNCAIATAAWIRAPRVLNSAPSGHDTPPAFAPPMPHHPVSAGPPPDPPLTAHAKDLPPLRPAGLSAFGTELRDRRGC
ncbi:hypothetical protein D3C86_1743360 [compost metagenome]